LLAAFSGNSLKSFILMPMKQAGLASFCQQVVKTGFYRPGKNWFLPWFLPYRQKRSFSLVFTSFQLNEI
jgi:hypothetical protein